MWKSLARLYLTLDEFLCKQTRSLSTLSCCAFSSSYWVLYLRPIFLTCVIVFTFSCMSATLASSSFCKVSFSVLILVTSSFRFWTRFWLVVKDAFVLNSKRLEGDANKVFETIHFNTAHPCNTMGIICSELCYLGLHSTNR